MSLRQATILFCFLTIERLLKCYCYFKMYWPNNSVSYAIPEFSKDPLRVTVCLRAFNLLICNSNLTRLLRAFLILLSEYKFPLTVKTFTLNEQVSLGKMSITNILLNRSVLSGILISSSSHCFLTPIQAISL